MGVGSLLRSSIVVVTLMLVGAMLPGCEQRETLVTVDSQREAIEILVELARVPVVGAKVQAQTVNRKQVQAITLPTSEIARGRTLLLERDLPRRERGGLESFVASAGVIPTPADERAKLMHAISGELERTLEAIAGVSRARVHVVLPEKDSFSPSAGVSASDGHVTAAVLLVVVPPKEESQPAALTVAENKKPLAEAAKELVSHAVPGLDPSHVTVVTSSLPVINTDTSGTPNSDVAEANKELESLRSVTPMLLIASASLGVLFVFTLAWGIFMRGPKLSPAGGDLATS